MKTNFEKRQQYASEVNKNKSLFQVYGMDKNGANILYENCQIAGDDNGLGFAQALDCYNSIQLENEGDSKYLTVQIIDEDGNSLFSQNLLEDEK